jgi:signal transduction histidine kinase
MSSSDAPRRQLFGLRLALWYSTLFVVGATLIVFLTYWLTSVSLAQRDRQIIDGKLGEYATVYRRGGLRALTDTVRTEQATSSERLYVRVVDRGTDAVVLSNTQGWDRSQLELGTLRLPDGAVIQVGKSTEARSFLLARFRAVLGVVTLSIVIMALAGGWVVTQTAVQPLRRLSAAVDRIVRTGRTDERVEIAAQNDEAINELTRLFNEMLDKIEGLVTGMRGALDNVSHDLRTPLTRLRGSAELALAAPPDLERYREALADCVEETDHVLVMLETLMDISEAESGALPLAREPVPLGAVVERAVDLYRDVADAKDVTLESAVPEPLTVIGDPIRLEQVAANLVDNAIKYTPAGGRVSAGVRREGNAAVLWVKDTGPGMRADEVPRIWERLFRGDVSRTERGLGLGLSLVKAIVEAHGGTVGVETAPGAGSTFWVRLSIDITAM